MTPEVHLSLYWTKGTLFSVWNCNPKHYILWIFVLLLLYTLDLFTGLKRSPSLAGHLRAAQMADTMFLHSALVIQLRESRFLFRRHSSPEYHLRVKYAARASFEVCFCWLEGRLVFFFFFFFSFLFGRSCFKLEMVEVLFIDALSPMVSLPDSRDSEAVLLWADISGSLKTLRNLVQDMELLVAYVSILQTKTCS